MIGREMYARGLNTATRNDIDEADSARQVLSGPLYKVLQGSLYPALAVTVLRVIVAAAQK